MRHKRDEKELEIIRSVATNGNDRPVTMLNLNRYVSEAGFPDGDLYRALSLIHISEPTRRS